SLTTKTVARGFLQGRVPGRACRSRTVAARSGCGVMDGVSCGRGSVPSWIARGSITVAVCPGVRDPCTLVCVHGVTAASRRLQNCAMSFGHHMWYKEPTLLCPFPHHCRHAAEREGGR